MHDRALSSAARPSAAAGAGSDRAGWLRTHWQELLRLLLGSVARTIHLLLYVLPLVGDGAENSKPTYLQELQAHVCVPATTWLAFGGSRWPTWWPVASSVTQPVLSHLCLMGRPLLLLWRLKDVPGLALHTLIPAVILWGKFAPTRLSAPGARCAVRLVHAWALLLGALLLQPLPLGTAGITSGSVCSGTAAVSMDGLWTQGGWGQVVFAPAVLLQVAAALLLRVPDHLQVLLSCTEGLMLATAYSLTMTAAGWSSAAMQQQLLLLWGAALLLPGILTWWFLRQAAKQPQAAAPAATAPDSSRASNLGQPLDSSGAQGAAKAGEDPMPGPSHHHSSSGSSRQAQEAGKQTGGLPSAAAPPTLGLLPSGPSLNLNSSSTNTAMEQRRVLLRLRSKSATDGPSAPLSEAPPARRVQSSGPTYGLPASGPGAPDATPFLRWPLERYVSPVAAGVLLVQVTHIPVTSAGELHVSTTAAAAAAAVRQALSAHGPLALVSTADVEAGGSLLVVVEVAADLQQLTAATAATGQGPASSSCSGLTSRADSGGGAARVNSTGLQQEGPSSSNTTSTSTTTSSSRPGSRADNEPAATRAGSSSLQREGGGMGCVVVPGLQELQVASADGSLWKAAAALVMQDNKPYMDTLTTSSSSSSSSRMSSAGQQATTEQHQSVGVWVPCTAPSTVVVVSWGHTLQLQLPVGLVEDLMGHPSSTEQGNKCTLRVLMVNNNTVVLDQDLDLQLLSSTSDADADGDGMDPFAAVPAADSSGCWHLTVPNPLATVPAAAPAPAPAAPAAASTEGAAAMATATREGGGGVSSSREGAAAGAVTEGAPSSGQVFSLLLLEPRSGGTSHPSTAQQQLQQPQQQQQHKEGRSTAPQPQSTQQERATASPVAAGATSPLAPVQRAAHVCCLVLPGPVAEEVIQWQLETGAGGPGGPDCSGVWLRDLALVVLTHQQLQGAAQAVVAAAAAATAGGGGGGPAGPLEAGGEGGKASSKAQPSTSVDGDHSSSPQSVLAQQQGQQQQQQLHHHQHQARDHQQQQQLQRLGVLARLSLLAATTLCAHLEEVGLWSTVDLVSTTRHQLLTRLTRLDPSGTEGLGVGGGDRGRRQRGKGQWRALVASQAQEESLPAPLASYKEVGQQQGGQPMPTQVLGEATPAPPPAAGWTAGAGAEAGWCLASPFEASSSNLPTGAPAPPNPSMGPSGFGRSSSSVSGGFQFASRAPSLRQDSTGAPSSGWSRSNSSIQVSRGGSSSSRADSGLSGAPSMRLDSGALPHAWTAPRPLDESSTG